MMRCSVTPTTRTASRPAARPQSMPSMAARARLARVLEAIVRPCTLAVASGRFGVRSPSKYGTSTTPAEPGSASRASRARPSWSTPRSPAMEPRTRAALSVATSGRKSPLASANPATAPVGSIAGLLGVDHDGLARLALEAEPGSAGVVLVPYFEGERTPNLPEATASVHGLTIASSTRANLARAAIEGMLCGLAAGLDAVRVVGVTEQRIMLIGHAN